MRPPSSVRGVCRRARRLRRRHRRHRGTGGTAAAGGSGGAEADGRGRARRCRGNERCGGNDRRRGNDGAAGTTGAAGATGHGGTTGSGGRGGTGGARRHRGRRNGRRRRRPRRKRGRRRAAGGRGGIVGRDRHGRRDAAPAARRRPCKRGIAANTAPGAAFYPAVRWWYNWGLSKTGGNTGIEFVPMIWGSSTVNGPIPAGSKYLLGFNEPNFKAQSNLTPLAAADRVARAADQRAQRRRADRRGPALNFCGPAANCNGTDPYVYLKDFLAACTNCQVDHIAVHWYDDFPSLRAYIESNASLAGWEQFGKPIWLTEFSLDGSATAAQQEAFMRAGHPVPRRPPERLPLLVVQRRPDPEREAHQQRRLADRPRSGLHQPGVELPVAACGGELGRWSSVVDAGRPARGARPHHVGRGRPRVGFLREGTAGGGGALAHRARRLFGSLDGVPWRRVGLDEAPGFWRWDGCRLEQRGLSNSGQTPVRRGLVVGGDGANKTRGWSQGMTHPRIRFPRDVTIGRGPGRATCFASLKVAGGR